MRRYLTALVVVVALAIPAVALAATLETGKFGDLIEYGDKCENGAFYHFVNNQTGGATGGTLTAVFSNGTETAQPYMVLPSVLHFSVFSTGELLSANTGGVPGKLVLSDVSCKK